MVLSSSARITRSQIFWPVGKLLLMFSAGLEVDLALFKKAKNRSIAFGILTTFLPLFLASFVIMLAMLVIAGSIASAINLPEIVGAFLAGLAVNAAVQRQPAKQKLEFFGSSIFISMFFIGTGFLINPVTFVDTIIDNLSLALAIILALLTGKAIAAEIASRVFGYTGATRGLIWSLTLPQVAATLAATLVAYDTFNSAEQAFAGRQGAECGPSAHVYNGNSGSGFDRTFCN